jgi:uracil-DNA glycosylase
MLPPIPRSWQAVLRSEVASPAFRALDRSLQRDATTHAILPPAREIFAALKLTPYRRVNVLILGQDPYPTPGHAHGLAFSVRPGVKPPASLRNIFTELEADVGFRTPSNGYLAPWAEQGVLLLNAVLTVERGRAGSHAGKGWEGLTDACIDALNRDREHLVFLLWGAYAQKKGSLIDRQRHLVLKAPHPSPLARGGFDGCGHFSKANEYLKARGETPIDWRLPSRSALEPA